MKSKVLMIALLLQAMLLQPGFAEEFPIGAYVHRPDTSVLRQANFDWMVVMAQFDEAGNNALLNFVLKFPEILNIKLRPRLKTFEI